MEFVAAKCPNCGGDLRLPDDKQKVKCMYCSFDIIVRDAVNAGQVNVENLLRLGISAQDAQNYQEAYDYFTKVLEYDADNYIAHWGKGFCSAQLSTPEKFRFDELKSGIVNGVNNAPEDKKEELKVLAIRELNRISKKNVPFNGVVMKSKPLLTQKQKIESLEIIYSFEPQNEVSLENLIFEVSGNSDKQERYLSELQAIAPERAKSIREIFEKLKNENAEQRKKERFQRKIKKAFGKLGDKLVVVLPIIITLGVIFFCAFFCRTGR